MAKNLIFCFDGTANDPEDAVQERTRTGGLEDDNITNVLKLHLLFGGDLADGNAHGLNQLSLYYPGVGTYGSKFKQIFNVALAWKDVGRIIEEAIADLENHYQNGDQIFLFGFSRGAAIARRFASVIGRDLPKKYKVRFMGVFDTVASLGMPDLDVSERPASDVLFENRTIGKNVSEALHLCSIDDKRKAFQPTLMNAEERVTEVWFAGAHSDVGGGFRRDGLSDSALRFMLDELERRGLGVQTIPPSEIRYKQLGATNGDLGLDYDDLVIEPSPFGKNHQQSRIWPIAKWTLYDRKVVVVVNDKITARKPLVHHCVAERIYGDPEYRPVGLKGRKHGVLSADNSQKTFDGLGHHVRVGMRTLKPLKVRESRELPVMAHQFYNRTGLLLERGRVYRFKVKPNQTWRDGGIPCDADGWNRDDISKGWIKELGIKTMEPFRRQAEADWFALVGAVGDAGDELFTIGKAGIEYIPKKSDEFCPFANDLKRMYGNNDGRILLTVTRVR
jgi:hypothetical protein